MSTSRVESVPVVLGLCALLCSACSAAESKGDVDLEEKTPASTGGAPGSGGAPGTGGRAGTGGSSAAGCPDPQPDRGDPCTPAGTVCEYDETTCTCRMTRGWDCTGF